SRMNLAFLDGEDLCVLHISKLNDAVKAGTLASETVVFDNTVVNIGEFRERWMVSLSKSWAWSRVEAIAG
ncbi:MAG: hypothetical protein ACJATS_000488, partial [Psychroserpens sp.]